ncbi:major facilitator superfamily domain-containing protein [Lophiotrema nucula]|uniref:Major facilitator superfamily domain-containing protein n=1 Tax=Lophiotrema nucula TaxID=690887 RepID=A0A6A5YDG3_9PLEO|nr:major facilitator superfamily domain-containing protein [Lophiotrema nucula]
MDRIEEGKKSRISDLKRSSTPNTELLLKGRQSLERIKSVKKVGEWNWRFYATGLALVIINLVAAWDATALPIALPSIATALKGSAVDAFWLGIASLVAATIFIPLYSTLSNIFGRKAMLLIASAFFTLGSFIAAVGGNFSALHLGRSLQGIGAGGIYVLSNIVVADLVSEVDRKQWSVILGATWVIGVISGPIIGGVLVQNGQWRWIFWLPLPFCGLAFIILPIFSQLKERSTSPILPMLREFDWLGFLLFAASIVSILLGVTWGGVTHSWSNVKSFLPIQFGLIGFIVFLCWSWFSPLRPTVNVAPFAGLTSISTYFSTFVLGIVTFATLYFLPIYFQAHDLDISLTEVGIWLFPWTVTLAVFALLTYLLIDRWGHWRPAIWTGWLFLMLGVALMTLFSRDSTNATWIGIAILGGIGAGLLYTSLAAAADAASTSRQENVDKTAAVTNIIFFRTLGQTLGVVISCAIFQNTFHNQLVQKPLLRRVALVDARNAVALISTTRSMPADAGEFALRSELQDAFIASLKPIWVVMAALAGAAFVVSLLMRSTSRRQGVPQQWPRPRRTEIRSLEVV